MLSRKQKRMVKMVKAFQEYVASYSKQMCYEDYSDETFIHDMIYGIGIALDKKEYTWANGYAKWKAKLVSTVFKKEAQQVIQPDNAQQVIAG